MKKAVSISIGLFFAFFAYFSFTSYHLPNSAGPDFKFSRLAADFYYEENRLAVVPDDIDKMVFSKYGNSRLLRPPLGFFFSAQVAKLPILNKANRAYAYRVGVAMLAASTVLLLFLSLKVYFNSYRYALFGSVAIGLMPQFTFYASYFSDDMIAIFAASLLAYAMVLIYKHGVSLWRQLLFALAAGICIVSKATAWVFLAPAILFYLLFMLEYSKDYFLSKDFYKPFLLMGLAFIVGGGWWLIFNVYHYGLDDYRLSNVVAELAESRSTLDLSALGFKMKGLDIQHLIFLNSKNFLGASYIAFVANLDWLRLKVGTLQYGFYLWMIAGFVLNTIVLAYQTAMHLMSRLTYSDTEFSWGQFKFETILYIAVLLQFYIYTYHNVESDVQIQGKYLMTIFVPLLILSLSFYKKAIDYLTWRFADVLEIPTAIQYSLFASLIAFTVLIHIDALVDFVIPFYWPNMEIPAILSWL